MKNLLAILLAVMTLAPGLLPAAQGQAVDCAETTSELLSMSVHAGRTLDSVNAQTSSQAKSDCQQHAAMSCAFGFSAVHASRYDGPANRESGERLSPHDTQLAASTGRTPPLEPPRV